MLDINEISYENAFLVVPKHRQLALVCNGSDTLALCLKRLGYPSSKLVHSILKNFYVKLTMTVC